MTKTVSTSAGAWVGPWQDTALASEQRVELLLAAMTLEEKVAQLGSRWVGNDMGDAEISVGENNNVAPMQDIFAASGR